MLTRFLSARSRSVAVRAARARSAKNPFQLEKLEDRTLLAVSVGSDGFTNITKSSDSRVIYVSSSSGSDSNSGLTADRPVRSISKGLSLMRSGAPDHVLLKRGDSWTERIGLSKSGRSSQEPAVLGAYGSGARPLIKAGNGHGIEVARGSVNNFAIMGIHLFAHTRDPNIGGFSRTDGGYGVRWVGGTSNLLIEDSVFDQFRFNLCFEPFSGSQSNVKIRRSIITDAYSLGGHSSGLYAQNVNGLTLEENVFDHNGWNERVSGGGATPQNHNAYISQGNNNVVVKGNIFANGSSHGLQARAGGEIRENFFIQNPIHMSFGLVNGSPIKPGGVTGTVDGNVFVGGRTIGSGTRGWAVELGNIRSASVRNNIMQDDGPGTMAAINLAVGTNITNLSSHVGINNVTIENNIVHKWDSAIATSSDFRAGGTSSTSVNNLVIRNNDFQNVTGRWNRIVLHGGTSRLSTENWSNNRYWDAENAGKWFFIGTTDTHYDSWRSRFESTAQNTRVNYSNPNASISSYAGSYSNFINEARRQGEGNWRGTYTARGAVNYFRGAFNRSGTSNPTPTPDPTPTAPVSGAPAIAIGDASVTEGNSGTKSLSFPVTLSRSSTSTVSVRYATANGTAGEGDYGVTSGTVSFSPGQTSKTISIVVKGDTKVESNETFKVNLSSASNAGIADSQAIGTIINDDGTSSGDGAPAPAPSTGTPALTIGDASIDEGNSGTRSLLLPVTLSSPASSHVSVRFATANRTAGEGDYGVTSGTVTLSPGQTSTTIPVAIKGDTKIESDEAFAVSLSSAANASIADGQAIGTIRNDDGTSSGDSAPVPAPSPGTPSIRIGDASVYEGNSGTKTLLVPVTLSGATSSQVTVRFATSNKTAGEGDYGVTSGTVTFSPGQTSQTIPVVIKGDTKVESDEAFAVNLSGAVNGTIADSQAIATIRNDDR